MVSKETAVKFTSDVLRINDVELKLESNKLSLLNEIIRAHHQYIPFQNLNLFSTDAEERCNPTPEDCIVDGLKAVGGMCITLNGFFVSLLQSLGFNAFLVSGNILQSDIRDCHLVINVCDIEEPGDKYYVDVGFGFPTFAAIPIHTLDEGQSDVYQYAFHTLRLTRDGDKYVRSHKKNTVMGELSENPEDHWEKFIEFDCTSRDLSYFDEPMKAIYTDKKISLFLNIVFGTIYPPGKAITVRNLTVRIWDEETNSVEQLNFDSTEKASVKVSELFPMIPLETIKNGYNAWHTSVDHERDTTKLL